jgi:2-polyprenyl-6-methoxyphenol hydroxylase-like FAD-dependent oxidoreductase
MNADVIVIGAGPVGLMLAGELRLGGADVIVFEQRETPCGETRGLGFTSRAAEVFDQRGLLARFGEVEMGTQAHFAGVRIDPALLDEHHLGVRSIPQHHIEKVLEDWARELGASVMRGYTLTDLKDSGDRVVAVVDGPDGSGEHTARYLVGCDGARSRVRHLTGIDFTGTEATRGMYLAEIAGKTMRPRYVGERVPGGMVMSFPLEGGAVRITIHEDVAPPPAPDHVVTFTEVADAWQRMTGESVHDAEPLWVSAFTDATRQASEYQRGRVFVAGDAGHIHLPVGSQGLSVGVQDAVNLGWKLAATIKGWAPEDLIGTYHGERHPVGARVLCNTLAQRTIYLNGDEMDPLRAVMGELVAIPAVARHLAAMVSGLDIRYDMGASGHPLLGKRIPPNKQVTLPGGRQVYIAELMHRARGVLVSTGHQDGTARLAARWSDRVDMVTGRWSQAWASGGAPVESVLIRPDGYVAWVTPDGGQLEDALRRWVGSPQCPEPIVNPARA